MDHTYNCGNEKKKPVAHFIANWFVSLSEIHDYNILFLLFQKYEQWFLFLF